MRMKRILLYLLALAPLGAFADVPPSGYYRVQNYTTNRYMTIVDDRADIDVSSTIADNVKEDFQAIFMTTGFEENIAYNPASICYFQYVGSTQYNLSGQGLDLHDKTGHYINVKQNTNDGSKGYWFYASVVKSGLEVKRYLNDNTYHGTKFCPSISVTTTNDNTNWRMFPVDQNENSYLGVKPDITASADGSYWATMYAGFPFKASAVTTKIYRVSKVDNAQGVAVIKEITDYVPLQTPVLFRCTGATPISNKLTLSDNTNAGSAVGDNCLKGNYYCNDVEESTGHRNVTLYNSATMRVLGVDADGKPAFVKGDDTNLVKSTINGKLYLPANKAYLVVEDAPDVLKIMTEEEYITGIEQITTSTTDGIKVIYDLQGRRVQTPSKGLYILNGKKMIIR